MFDRNKFNEDMAVGEAFERRFLEALEREHPDRYSWYKHPNCSGTSWHCKCYDLENLSSIYSERGEYITVECKHDFKFKYTSNMVIETYAYKTDKLKAVYWVQELDVNRALLFRVDDLRKYIPQFLDDPDVCREVKGGDGKRTEMALILDVKTFLQYVPHKKLYLEKTIPANIFF